MKQWIVAVSAILALGVGAVVTICSYGSNRAIRAELTERPEISSDLRNRSTVNRVQIEAQHESKAAEIEAAIAEIKNYRPKWNSTVTAHGFGPTAEFLAEQREIIAETTLLGGHDWAGEYRIGPGLNSEALHLSPSGRFAYSDGGCTYFYGITGEAHQIPGGFRFIRDDGNELFQLGRRHLVRWGPRRYLISDEGMISFIQKVNAGRLRKAGDTFGMARIGSDRVPVSGLPDLPEPYRSRLRLVPLAPRMTAMRMEAGNAVITFAVDDSTSLQPGTSLGAPDSYLRAKIRSLTPDGCEAVVKNISASNRERVLKILSECTGKIWTELAW